MTEARTVDLTKLFRPNPERAVYLNGVVDQSMVGALTPKIMGLFAVSNDPITAYINSSGGILVCARMIEGMLKTQSMDGEDRRVIGVGVGFAASAAADLLIGCDYAIAYPTCQILCHGTRFESNEPVTLTLEHADRFSRDLKKEDDDRALHLAQRVFERILFRYGFCAGEFDRIRSDYMIPDMNDLETYVEAIAVRVSSSASDLLDEASSRQSNLAALAETVYTSIPGPREGLQWERSVLDKLVEFEIEKNSKNYSWSLSRGGLDQVMLDFRMLQQAGDHIRTMQDLVTKSRRYFVSEQEEIKLRKSTESPSEIEERINALVATRMEPFWGFSFFLCRVLMEKDNPLSPEDAFWLGLIDEVAGNQELPTYRKAFETPPPESDPEQLNLPEPKGEIEP